MIGVGPTENVADIFNDSVLKASASAEKWLAGLPGKADRVESPRHSFVRTCRYNPYGLEPIQVDGSVADSIRGDPDSFHASNQAQCGGNGSGRHSGLVVISDQRNLQHHARIIKVSSYLFREYESIAPEA